MVKLFVDFFTFLHNFHPPNVKGNQIIITKKVIMRVASRAAERLKPRILGKLSNFREIPEMLGVDGKYLAARPKSKF